MLRRREWRWRVPYGGGVQVGIAMQVGRTRRPRLVYREDYMVRGYPSTVSDMCIGRRKTCKLRGSCHESRRQRHFKAGGTLHSALQGLLSWLGCFKQLVSQLLIGTFQEPRVWSMMPPTGLPSAHGLSGRRRTGTNASTCSLLLFVMLFEHGHSVLCCAISRIVKHNGPSRLPRSPGFFDRAHSRNHN